MVRIFILLLILSVSTASAGMCQYYWVGFTDKKNVPWKISNPNDFLSDRAINRRLKQKIAIDSLDLPVDPNYITQVLQPGVSLVHRSRWMNGITVLSYLPDFIDMASAFPFVREVQPTKNIEALSAHYGKFTNASFVNGLKNGTSHPYGHSYYQSFQIKIHQLHEQGYNGQGIQIAVLDAGFTGVDSYHSFMNLRNEGRILGTRDFVKGGTNVYDDHSHGTSVLSVMTGEVPGELIGTAPKASYWLLRTEDDESEYLIEEDNWIVAAEFADSAGVDIINSSLGYTIFNDPDMNHTYADMNGHTTRVTRGANIAASRGMVVISSAGNEGNSSWRHISAPSDGEKVLAVGAVNKDAKYAPFSSQGPASNGSIKPDVAAMGWNTVVQRPDGTIGGGNGTSFSAPVIAGAAAVLWQANTHATAVQVKNAIIQSAHQYRNPDNLLGYGIPDFQVADKLLKTHKPKSKKNWFVYPNPATRYIVIQKLSDIKPEKIVLSFYTLTGSLVAKEAFPDNERIIYPEMQNLPAGLLLLHINSGNLTEVVKINNIRL